MKRQKEQLNSKSGFKNPISVVEQRELEQPKDGKKSPWDFRAPCYDQRSSSFVNAGTHYGVGRNQPVGHVGNPKSRVDVLPYGRVDTMRVDERG